MARRLGLEPRLMVLETTVLPITPSPYGESGYIENHHEAISATYTVVRNTNIVALSTLWPSRQESNLHYLKGRTD